MPTKTSASVSFEHINSLAKTYAYILIAGAIAGILAAHIPGILGHPWSFCVEGGNTLECVLTVHLLEAPYLIFNLFVAWHLLKVFAYKNRARTYYLLMTLVVVDFSFFAYEIGTTLVGIRRSAPLYETITLGSVSLILIGGSLLGIYVLYKMTNVVFGNPSIPAQSEGLPPLDSDGFYHPTKEEQIQLLIKYAIKHNLKVRVRGSTHSVSWAIYTNSGDSPNGTTMQNPPGGRDINIMMDQMHRFTWVDKNTGIADVQAGIHLGMDPYDPVEPPDFNKYEKSLLIKANNEGWTLADVGGISHQTLGGFLSTGSAGGSLKYDLGKNFLAFRIIDGEGNIRWIDKEKDKDLFNAAGVSLGLLGIITEVRLKLTPNFNIKGKEIAIHTDPEKREIYYDLDIFGKAVSQMTRQKMRNLSEYLEEKEYTRILWYPQKGLNTLRIWMAERCSVDEPFADGEPRPYREFTRNRFTTYLEEMGAALLFTIAGNKGLWNTWVKLGLSYENFRWELNNLWSKHIGSILSGVFSTLFTFIVVLLSFILVVLPFTLFRKLYLKFFPVLLKLFQPVTSVPFDDPSLAFHDYMYRSLPMDNGASDIMMGIEFTELWIPMKYANEAMVVMDKHYKENGPSATGYSMTELYAGIKSDFWMSPAYGGNVLRIDIFWYRANEGDPSERGAYYDQFWRLFRDNNIPFKLHWGKFWPSYDLKDWSEYFKDQHPKWDDFMAIREERDPHNVFLTEYWRKHLGIEFSKELQAPNRALVISGGGARGAWGVGVAQALSCHQENIYQLVVGTSTGSLMGPLTLLRDFPTLIQQYITITQKQIFNVNPFKKNGSIKPLVFIWRLITGKETVGETKNLRHKIQQVFKHEHYEEILDKKLEFTAAVTSLTTSRPGFKSTQDYSYDDMVDWAWASANTPVFMSNVHKEGEVWADGGLRVFIPVAYAMEREARYIDVIVHDNQNFGSIDWSQKGGFFNLLLRVLAIYYTGTAVANVEDLGLEKRIAKCDHDITFYFMNQKELDEVGNDLVMNKAVMSKILDVGYNDLINGTITKKSCKIKKGQPIGTITLE